jgi:hypothetical protein
MAQSECRSGARPSHRAAPHDGAIVVPPRARRSRLLAALDRAAASLTLLIHCDIDETR